MINKLLANDETRATIADYIRLIESANKGKNQEYMIEYDSKPDGKSI